MSKIPDPTSFREITSITIEGICEDGVKRAIILSDFEETTPPLISTKTNYKKRERPTIRPQVYNPPPLIDNFEIQLEVMCKKYTFLTVDCK